MYGSGTPGAAAPVRAAPNASGRAATTAITTTAAASAATTGGKADEGQQQ